MTRKPAIKTKEQLIVENEDLQRRLEEAEETLNALRNGEVDAIVVSGAQGEQVFTLKQVEEALRVSEEKYRKLVDENRDGFYITDIQGLLTFANPALARILGVTTPQALLGRKFSEFLAPEMHKELVKAYRSMMENGGGSGVINGQIERTDGTRVFIEIKPVPLFKEGKAIGSQGVIRDITEHKRAEGALQESETEYRNLFENSVVGISQALPDGHLVRANNSYAQMYGYANPGEMIADVTHIARLYAHPKDREEELRTLAARGIMEPREMEVVRRDGTHMSVLVGARAIRDSKGNLRFYQAEHVEITQRKRAEEKIKRQLEHLLALSSIDRLIAANFDLKLSLSEILNFVTKELGVDAADILLLNPGLQMLEYGADQGFRTNAIRKTNVRLGESYAGRVALERQLVRTQNPVNETDKLFLATHLAGEAFACYFGVPLIAKGQIKGVLEIFHRTALEPETEWFDFLNNLAGQAAIAIENSTLFESLQQSNSELGLAYDATIEGWSHAMDLRDKETEGHTLRVTETTVKLARRFGYSEADLVQIRWGALLHDIGKIGVPDRILLKPGPLTDEEWLVMKKHPSFAYEMLSPIRYLRLALDIPYCHHEKWDGSGYPRGLKGPQIPLVGRIFAVVDVWDALRSDRPYRPAWATDKVREHIRSSAGTHFDPQVVDVFMQMLD
jgi:PAS domain S-box-containing protein/putative nucleotidyltransferase with HDIG domain